MIGPFQIHKGKNKEIRKGDKSGVKEKRVYIGRKENRKGEEKKRKRT